MAFKLTPEIQQRRREYEQAAAEKRREVAAMSDETLAASIRYAQRNMASAQRWQPGEPVYDGVFHHMYVPELLKRLKMLPPEEKTHALVQDSPDHRAGVVVDLPRLVDHPHVPPERPEGEPPRSGA